MMFMSIILLITFMNVEGAGDIITDGAHDYVLSDARYQALLEEGSGRGREREGAGQGYSVRPVLARARFGTSCLVRVCDASLVTSHHRNAATRTDAPTSHLTFLPQL